jgi:hypothetical protein
MINFIAAHWHTVAGTWQQAELSPVPKIHIQQQLPIYYLLVGALNV